MSKGLLSFTIIKLGGSLMGSAELPLWLERIASFAKTSDIIIVPGGGPFADSVRAIQKNYKFDDLLAHQMALFAMCQYGYLLSAMNSNIKIVDNFQVLSSYLGKQAPLLWLPLLLIEDHSDIKASWEFTSDSIALWLAIKLSARKLILVKSKSLKNDRSLLTEHINNNDIDRGFQSLIDNYSGDIYFMEKKQHRLLT